MVALRAAVVFVTFHGLIAFERGPRSPTQRRLWPALYVAPSCRAPRHKVAGRTVMDTKMPELLHRSHPVPTKLPSAIVVKPTARPITLIQVPVSKAALLVENTSNRPPAGSHHKSLQQLSAAARCPIFMPRAIVEMLVRPCACLSSPCWFLLFRIALFELLLSRWPHPR